MSLVDVNRIINGTPEKRILNAYNKMKENYTEATAQEFKDVYIKESDSSILDSSRMIFSEPYFGLDYYKEILESVSNYGFTRLYNESDKIHSFVEENGSLMDEKQKKIYEEAVSFVDNLLAHRKNAMLYGNYIKENVNEEFEDKLFSLAESYRKESSDENAENIITLFESSIDPLVYFVYAPYASKLIEESGLSSRITDLSSKFCEEKVDEDEKTWASFVEKVICLNKMKNDSTYMEAVNDIPCKDDKIVFETYMGLDLSKLLTDMRETVVNEEEVISPDPVSAVNKIFFSITESVDEDNENRRAFLDNLERITYEATMNILISEYQQTDDINDKAVGYSLIKEDVNIEEAFVKIQSIYQEKADLFLESDKKDDDDDEEDVSDEEIDKMEKDEDESDKPDKEDKDGSNGKKQRAPEAKNLANRIQFKAMDAEAKQMKNKAVRQQKGQEIINAGKAVAQIPKNVIDSIKDQIHKIDKVDDERRKNYMTEPGFRKKAFRNLKLAILYGGAAQVKLALVPVVAIGRHFSKDKDRRIRNETVREIQTEIKICDEKISDANSNGDQKEKYRLMRIKDQLDAELVRVKTNSKYV